MNQIKSSPWQYRIASDEYKSLSASRVSEVIMKIRYSQKLIRRKAEDAAAALDPFSFEEFEKVFILNNPLVRRRQPLKTRAVKSFATAEDFDYSPYFKKFPILTAAFAEPGTFGFTYFPILRS